jgi:hypothetical protein
MENKYPKLSLQDVVKYNHLSSNDILELKEIVDALNKIAEENPEYIDYLNKRYPKNDPRLAELNWKMDQMLSASDEYIETHFPENQKLFKTLQQSIKRNIKLTDPKTFKNVADVVPFRNLLSVDYVNNNEKPKRKLKLQSRNKKTAARFLKKPKLKTKSELIDEKIQQLDIDMKKTQRGD